MTGPRVEVGSGAGIATLAWLIGALVLGFRWAGHQTNAGTWQDGVSLTRWVVCWLLLAVLALGTAPLLPRWRTRLLVLLPLVAWIIWQLRDGALGPLPMVIYLVPTVLVWSGALTASDRLRGRPPTP